MSIFNKWMGIGRTTKEPVFRTTTNAKGETSVATFTLAVERAFVNADGQKEADFIPCVAWGRTADIIHQYVGKGDQLVVSGEIRTGHYDNKDGQRVYTTEIYVQEMRMLGGKRSQQNVGGNEPVQAAPAPSPMSGMGTDVPYDEEVPF